MEFLSLQEPVEVPIVRVSRSEAILLSIGLHVVLVLLFLFGPGVASRVLPESVIAFLAARPRALRESADRSVAEPKVAERIPLKFEYVRTPDDGRVEKNPAAKILSDKNRIARQDVPTPPARKDFSIDPHSEGTTVERIRPDPRLAEGRDALEPAPAGARESEDRQQAELRPEVKGAEAPEIDDSLQSGQKEGGGGAPPLSAAEGVGTARGGPGPQRDPGTGPVQGSSSNRLPQAARESLQRALSGQGEESKRLFDNPGYLSPGFVSGTLSFDTQDFPWGDYARRIHVIIQNGWSDHLPLAFREGVRGYLCVHFVIQKDGTITDVQVIRPSVIPPFNRAVQDTLRAVSPLPELPEGFPGAQEGLSGCFFYNMQPGEIRDLMR
jgi:TonB family protein